MLYLATQKTKTIFILQMSLLLIWRMLVIIFCKLWYFRKLIFKLKFGNFSKNKISSISTWFVINTQKCFTNRFLERILLKINKLIADKTQINQTLLFNHIWNIWGKIDKKCLIRKTHSLYLRIFQLEVKDVNHQ